MTQPTAYDNRNTPQDVIDAMLEYHLALQEANRNAIAVRNAVNRMYDHHTAFNIAIQEHGSISTQLAHDRRKAYQDHDYILYHEWQWCHYFYELALQHSETKRVLFVARVDPRNRTGTPHQAILTSLTSM
jgi:hypothetical protein